MGTQSRKKYFFFDVDGTLVPMAGGREIPDSTRAAISELKRRGHFCAIATGRSQCMAQDFCRELGFDNMVSDGGNGITLEGKLLELSLIHIYKITGDIFGLIFSFFVFDLNQILFNHAFL